MDDVGSSFVGDGIAMGSAPLGDQSQAGSTGAVISRASDRVGQHVTSFVDILKLYRCVGSSVAVGMIAPRQTSERRVNTTYVGRRSNTQYRIVIDGRRRDRRHIGWLTFGIHSPHHITWCYADNVQDLIASVFQNVCRVRRYLPASIP